MRLTVDLNVDDGCTLPLDEAAIERILAFVLDVEGVERFCLVSVSFVGDDAMQALNLEWRGIDAATDVLSLECERPDDPDLGVDEPCELGDIVVAPDYVARQAAKLDTAFETELTLLLVHGMLHLLGYDHIEEDEAQRMEAREDELVSALVGESSHVTLTRHKEGDEA